MLGDGHRLSMAIPIDRPPPVSGSPWTTRRPSTRESSADAFNLRLTSPPARDQRAFVHERTLASVPTPNTGHTRSFLAGRYGPLASCLAALALWIMLPDARAQDVIVGPVAWASLVDPPDVLPTTKDKLEIPFPAELKAMTTPTYAIIEGILDAKGKRLSWNVRSPLDLLERTVGDASRQWRFTPAQREGKAVISSIRLAVLFNPANAAPAAPDRPARLLDAAYLNRLAPKDTPKETSIADEVIMADVTINEAGQATAITQAPAELTRPLLATARRWRFEPARENGQPVPSILRVPFVVVTHSRDGVDGKKRTPPRVLTQSEPVYPLLMRASGLRGEVNVAFEVDIEGRVRNCHVTRSLNPSFDDAAIEAVRRWRFEPGLADGVPTTTRMQVPVIFQIEGEREGGDGPLRITRKVDPMSLPEGYRYDTAPRPVHTVLPVYPYAALRDDESGQAEVQIVISPEGKVVFAQVVSATKPEFGFALKASLEHFVFEPALLAGTPTRASLRFSQSFERFGRQQIVNSEDMWMLRMEKKHPEQILRLSELDGPLKPIARRPVEFPRGTEARAGKAMIEFLIDQEGRVRLPRVVSASEEPFGYAAVQSVSKWLFEVPLQAGRPVVVRASLPLDFKLQ